LVGPPHWLCPFTVDLVVPPKPFRWLAFSTFPHCSVHRRLQAPVLEQGGRFFSPFSTPFSQTQCRRCFFCHPPPKKGTTIKNWCMVLDPICKSGFPRNPQVLCWFSTPRARRLGVPASHIPPSISTHSFGLFFYFLSLSLWLSWDTPSLCHWFLPPFLGQSAVSPFSGPFGLFPFPPPRHPLMTQLAGLPFAPLNFPYLHHNRPPS